MGLVGIAIAGGALWQSAGGGYATTGLVRLPRPVSPARAVIGADFNLPGLTPYFTANRDFYRIDTALVVPRLNLDSWELRIHGMVDNPVTLTFDDDRGEGDPHAAGVDPVGAAQWSGRPSARSRSPAAPGNPPRGPRLW